MECGGGAAEGVWHVGWGCAASVAVFVAVVRCIALSGRGTVDPRDAAADDECAGSPVLCVTSV